MSSCGSDSPRIEKIKYGSAGVSYFKIGRDRTRARSKTVNLGQVNVPRVKMMLPGVNMIRSPRPELSFGQYVGEMLENRERFHNNFERIKQKIGEELRMSRAGGGGGGGLGTEEVSTLLVGYSEMETATLNSSQGSSGYSSQ